MFGERKKEREKEGCLNCVGTYLLGTVLQGCRLFKRCQSLPAGHCDAGVQAVKAVLEPTRQHCVAGVQTVQAVSEPTCRALCCRGTDCLSGVGTCLLGTVCWGAGCLSSGRTYLPGTVLQECKLLKQCLNLHAGHCVAGCRLLKQCRNLPPMHCGTGDQAVQAVWEPTCRVLCCRGAVCLSDVRTYLWGALLQGCRLFKQCPNLPTGQCVSGV